MWPMGLCLFLFYLSLYINVCGLLILVLKCLLCQTQHLSGSTDTSEDLFALLELDTVVGSPLPTELLSLGKIPSIDSLPISLSEQVLDFDVWIFLSAQDFSNKNRIDKSKYVENLYFKCILSLIFWQCWYFNRCTIHLNTKFQKQ